MAFRSISENHTGITGKTLDVSPPSGIVDNDCLVAIFVLKYGGESRPTTITPPSGFTLIEGPFQVSNGATDGADCLVYLKTASSESGNYTFSTNTDVGGIGAVVIAYKGIDVNKGTSGLDVDGSTENIPVASTFDAPSVTTTARKDQQICLCFGFQDTDYIQIEMDAAEPADLTSRLAKIWGDGNGVGAIVIADKIAIAEGATAVQTFSYLDTKDKNATYTLALFNLGRANKKLVTPLI